MDRRGVSSTAMSARMGVRRGEMGQGPFFQSARLIFPIFTCIFFSIWNRESGEK